jgi:hypothetical protein
MSHAAATAYVMGHDCPAPLDDWVLRSQALSVKKSAVVPMPAFEAERL